MPAKPRENPLSSWPPKPGRRIVHLAVLTMSLTVSASAAAHGNQTPPQSQTPATKPIAPPPLVLAGGTIIDVSDWGAKPFDWTPGGSTTWAIFDHDTEYFGRPEQAFMVNFRVADLDAMLAQLRSAGVDVIDALEESEYGRFGWAVDPEGTRFELWEPPPGG